MLHSGEGGGGSPVGAERLGTTDVKSPSILENNGKIGKLLY